MLKKYCKAFTKINITKMTAIIIPNKPPEPSVVVPKLLLPKDDEKAYKAAHAHEWFGEKVNVDEIIVTEDSSEWNESSKISPMIEIDNDDEQDSQANA